MVKLLCFCLSVVEGRELLTGEFLICCLYTEHMGWGGGGVGVGITAHGTELSAPGTVVVLLHMGSSQKYLETKNLITLIVMPYRRRNQNKPISGPEWSFANIRKP